MLRMTNPALGAVMLGISLAATSVDSSAQESDLPRVGLLVLGGSSEILQPIREGFTNLGYVEGETMALEVRSAQGQLDRVPDLLAELLDLDVDVLVTVGAVGALVAQKMTTTTPVVFSAVIDPAQAAQIGQPNGNFTGITAFDPELSARQFELLKEVVTDVSRVAILTDRDLPTTLDDGSVAEGRNRFERAYVMAARGLGLQPQLLLVKGAEDVEEAFSEMKRERAEALVVLEVPATIFHQRQIAEAAALHQMPTVFPGGFADAGGLISYGTTIFDTLPRIPEYVQSILQGTEPRELPIEAITRLELVVNLKTAEEIGVTIPSGLIERADRVIE